MARHTITRAEMEQIEVAEVIASAAGGGNVTKRLYFVYNIGSKRMGYELRHGGSVEWFDELGLAIEAYNEL